MACTLVDKRLKANIHRESVSTERNVRVRHKGTGHCFNVSVRSCDDVRTAVIQTIQESGGVVPVGARGAVANTTSVPVQATEVTGYFDSKRKEAQAQVRAKRKAECAKHRQIKRMKTAPVVSLTTIPKALSECKRYELVDVPTESNDSVIRRTPTNTSRPRSSCPYERRTENLLAVLDRALGL